ncbi:Integrin alpha-10 [Varanus komodoensis]|nr:Integrin alpha-10 [Varanus komodoensis]
MPGWTRGSRDVPRAQPPRAALRPGRLLLALPPLLLLLPGFGCPFNIDVKRPQIFRGPREAQFGYKVLQHSAQGQKWLKRPSSLSLASYGIPCKPATNLVALRCTDSNLAISFLQPCPHPLDSALVYPKDSTQGSAAVCQHKGRSPAHKMLVGAPWDGTADDRKGDIYKCVIGGRSNSTCSKVNIGDMALRNSSRQIRNMHFGMTLVANKDDGFVACAPLWSQECGTSMFSTGICTSVDENFQPTENIAPTAQRCSTYMDIVIVVDGSNSIYPWYEVQNFLSNILSKFFIDPEQIQVGVLQYSEVAVHEWSLKDYQTAEQVIEAAKNISRQEGLETRTASAIHKACTEAFSPERGGRKGATKLMIVVTDGESHDGDELPDALEECEERNVTRYAIAVLGHYIRRQKDPNSFINEIKYIASDPDEKYFFNVTDEAALNDIVDALGDRIFSLEGTREYSSFELEMSQVGFSTHLLEDGILFGIVGAYDWDGGVLKEGRTGRFIPPREAFEKEFPLKLKNHAAYLGYTVSSIKLRNGRGLYVAGAPRFKHKGKVVLFEMSRDGSVTISQALAGDQVGSYFGSEVCPVDVNGDGITDVLLVAAPMYLGPQNKETGRVYVYRVGQSLLYPNGTLHADAKPQDARFGYSLLVVPDLNHDSFNDVVVGAPLEENHQGAVYLYHGYRTTVLPRFKQRIESSQLQWGLSYFGRSLDGQIDLDGDGLVDLAIGAQGAAVVLRSRRIVQINVSISASPPSINVIRKNCQRSGKASVCVTAQLCFSASSRSLGPRDSHFGIKFNVSLDDRKFGSRAVFDGNSQKLLQKRIRATVGRTACSTARFHVLDTSDYMRPVAVAVRFALNDAEPGPVLDEKSPTTVKRLIPFFKDCGADDVCVTDLVLQAQMDIDGSRQKPHVIRKGKRKVLVDVLLENKKENAYNASLVLGFSRNLHFSSLALKGENPVKIECTTPSAQTRACSVGYPVFRASAKVAFVLEFEFSCSSLLDRAQVTIRASSDSHERNETLADNTAQPTVHVRYEPDLFLTSESALNRYEVHPVGMFPDGMSPEFRTTIKVQNVGCFAVQNLSLSMALPAMAYGSTEFLSVTRIIADNVSAAVFVRASVPTLSLPPPQTSHASRAGGGRCPEGDVWPAKSDRGDSTDSCGGGSRSPRRSRTHGETARRVRSGFLPPLQNCSNTWCQEVRCELPHIEKNAEVSVQLLRAVRNEFFRRANFKTVKVVSRFTLSTQKDSLLLLPKAGHQRETTLEIIQTKLVPVSLWILIGSIIGGLLLLALIIFFLWKLGFFAHKKPGEEEKEEQ